MNWPPTDENMPICCGKPMTYHASRQTRTAYVKGDYMRKGKERLDGGIPFGEVPGDRDYTQIEGDGHMRKSDFLEKTKGKDMGPLP